MIYQFSALDYNKLTMEYSHLTIPKHIKRKLDADNQNIIVRFPPEPSGYLHLGHIKALYINACVAKHYNGTLIVRFDDTNPILESNEFEKAILEDLKTLHIDTSGVSYTSDYFDQLIAYAELLISKGLAYVDLTDVEQMREMRETSTSSNYRDETIDVIMERWKLMKSNKDQKTNGVLRLKTDLCHKNKAMRDPTIYRSVDSLHHRTGDRFRVYPTYDFSCPIIDSIQNVTHVFRSVEYNERIDQGDFILDNLGLRKPLYYHYGRISIKDAELSKRKIKAGILAGQYEGWNDLRLYTFRSLLRKGIRFSAIEEFMKETSYSNGDVTLDPSKLWQINKRHIDPISSRYMVIEPSYKIFKVECEHKSKEIPKYVKNLDLGYRQIFYDNEILISDQINTPVCLMNWGSKLSMKELNGQLYRTQEEASQYVPWVTSKYIEVQIIQVIGNQLIQQNYLGEEAMRDIKIGDYIQLLQKGYYICENISLNAIKLINIC